MPQSHVVISPSTTTGNTNIIRLNQHEREISAANQAAEHVHEASEERFVSSLHDDTVIPWQSIELRVAPKQISMQAPVDY
jgi:hypothetical protein